MLDPSVKIRTLDQMARGTLRVLVATKAGELGADMKGVERVVVWRPKDGLDAVLQQAGRAARQGGRGLIVVYGAPNLKKAADSYCEGAKPSKEVQATMTTVVRACGGFLRSRSAFDVLSTSITIRCLCPTIFDREVLLAATSAQRL